LLFHDIHNTLVLNFGFFFQPDFSFGHDQQSLNSVNSSPRPIQIIDYLKIQPSSVHVRHTLTLVGLLTASSLFLFLGLRGLRYARVKRVSFPNLHNINSSARRGFQEQKPTTRSLVGLVIYEFFSSSSNILRGLSAYTEPSKIAVFCLSNRHLSLVTSLHFVQLP